MENKINITLIDYSDEDYKVVKNENYNIYQATVGSEVEISYEGRSSTKYCLLNLNLPPNLHEFDIVCLNQINRKSIPYNYEEHNRNSVYSEGVTKLQVSAPTNKFDPIPYGLKILGTRINEFRKKGAIMLLFADKKYEITYSPVYLKSDAYPKALEKETVHNYEFLNQIDTRNNKFGEKFKIIATGRLKQLIEQFPNLAYRTTFYEETYWGDDENGERVRKRNPNFFPLIVNANEEIISYLRFYEDLILFVFPDVENKGLFTKEFLERIAPDFSPELFTDSSKSQWIEGQEYSTPGIESIKLKISEEKENHAKNLKALKQKLESKRKEYEYLSKLLHETDDELVDAVFDFLKWLGFSDIKKVDEEKEGGVLEEDIYIKYKEKHLVIEIKGIGGTSKDSECSQISKVRYRKMKSLNSTDVSALYIVNHQRFIPPLSRQNPPFNPTQIQDAKNDDRGLLSTWELFKLWKTIDAGILTKEECRDILFDIGLIDFNKRFVLIGKVDKTFKENTIGSIVLGDIQIKNNDELIAIKNESIHKIKVISLEVNKEKVENAINCRAGIKFNKEIKPNTIIYRSSK